MLIDRGPFHELVYDILVTEHRALAALLEQALAIPASRPAERVATFTGFARLLRAHAHAEEKIFFPVLDGSYELGHHVREDAVAHARIGELLREIEGIPAMDPAWHHALVVLRMTLERHFDDEETVVFPRAHCVVGDARAMELGALYEYDRDEELARLAR
jgi:iron-sulfur cluster repair protein YtfE (RIC family)